MSDDKSYVRQFTRDLPKDWMRIQGREGVLRWIKDWKFIRNGLDSGYHPCCIATYKVRTLLMDLWAWAFNSQWLFNPNKGRMISYRVGDEGAEKTAHELMNSVKYKLARPGYIQCYLHKALMYAQQKPTEWYRCEKCSWAQIRFKTCRRCK